MELKMSQSPLPKQDKIVENVLEKYRQRSELGIKKYNTTLEENDKDDYLLHLQQELMDATLYIEKLMSKSCHKSLNNSDALRLEKLEILAKLLAKTWFYGDWEWETPNERIMQMLMQELGYYPFNDEDEMIKCTGIHDELYKKAVDIIPIRKLRMPLTEHIGEATEMIDQVPDVRKMVEDDNYLTPVDWLMDRIKWIHRETYDYLIKEGQYDRVKRMESSTSSQTEISDEEIEKLADEFALKYYTSGVTEDEVSAFVTGMKWYREQLKKKQ